MISNLYYRVWHDLLRLPKPITHMIIDNMTAHELIWNMAGAMVLTSTWVFIVHLIVTRNGGV